MWIFARGVKNPGICPEGQWPFKVHWLRKVYIKAGCLPDLQNSSLRLLGPSPSIFLHWKLLETPFFFTFLHRSTLELRILSNLSMDVLGLKTYDTVVELEWETFHERELKRWWTSFSSKDWAYIKQFLGDAISLFSTSLDWHLLEAITTCWDLALSCITIRDVDLVPILSITDSISPSQMIGRAIRPKDTYCGCSNLIWERLGL